MVFGRHVVRWPARTLRPVRGSVVRARTSTPWQIAATGGSGGAERGPRDGDLGRVEVGVREGDEDAHGYGALISSSRTLTRQADPRGQRETVRGPPPCLRGPETPRWREAPCR